MTCAHDDSTPQDFVLSGCTAVLCDGQTSAVAVPSDTTFTEGSSDAAQAADQAYGLLPPPTSLALRSFA